MTRETKIGLIVAGSFLCLVGIVVASKWHGGDGTDAEEQTVVPGGILQPTPPAGDAKLPGKTDGPAHTPPAVAAAEKARGPAANPKADKSSDLPGLRIAPASTPTIPTPIEEHAIEDELERKRLALLAAVGVQEGGAKAPGESGKTPMSGGVGALPMPPGEVGALPRPSPPGGVGTLPTPPGELGALPMPTPRGEIGTLPTPTPPGELPLPTPAGGLGALPTPTPAGGLGALPTPAGGLGTLPPRGRGTSSGELGALPTPPGGLGAMPPDGLPLPTPTPPPLGGLGTPPTPPNPFAKDGDNRPLPPPAPGTLGNLDFKAVKPFDDKTPIPAPKSGPFDPKGVDPLSAPEGGLLPGSPADSGKRAPAPSEFGNLPAIKATPGGDTPGLVPPFNALPPAPGPVAVIPPTGGVVLPAPPIIVSGGVRPLPAVKDVNTDIYEAQKGDSTFAILSLRMYGTDKYADALLQYNREHSGMVKNGSTFNFNPPVLSSGQQVLKPPAGVLDRDYSSLIRTAPPQVKILDTPTPLTPVPGPIAKVSNPPTPGPGGTYTVQDPNGESILDIAQRVFGDRDQWHKIYRVNPNYPPQNRIPPGATLTLPSN